MQFLENLWKMLENMEILEFELELLTTKKRMKQ